MPASAAAQTTAYDSAGRITRITNTVNSAYTRFVYPPSQSIVNKSTTINDLTTEAYRGTVYDGAGRMRAVAGDLPNSSGHYSGQFILYDIMGRAVQSTNPTEMTNTWTATGADYVGWYSSSQTYDWRGRPLVTTNQDGTTKEASYGGCGCAGGEVVTLTDEGTLLAGDSKKRQQKIYSDPLGRTVKLEILNWDGSGPFGIGGSVYSTTISNYNARDQVTSVKQYQGADSSGIYQETTMTYDGHGRLQTRHAPQQDANTATQYDYFDDDTVKKITDARGASTSLTYNNRHLVETVTYTAPVGITPTSPVTFEYDEAGNRSSMTDGLGSVGYVYDTLSRLRSETRTFSDPNYPAINGVVKTLAYDYNLLGELNKITDSTGMTIKYGFDSVGRSISVTGSDSLYAGVSNYSSNFQYRAWGGVKSVTDGRNRTSSVVYNSKLQATHFEISGNVVSQDYDYFSDGRIKFVNHTNNTDFDRSYSYDQVARLTVASSGAMANAESSGATPYHETFVYDAFSNLTARETALWDTLNLSDSGSYTNNRRATWGYDADGRNTTIDTRTNTFDAAGRQIQMSAQTYNGSSYFITQTHAYDGDGAMGRKAYPLTNPATSLTPTYYLRSSVFGGKIIEELNGSGQKIAGYVYHAGGRLLAVQASGNVIWKHVNPIGTGKYDGYSSTVFVNQVELDPTGADVGLTEAPLPDTAGGDGDVGSNHFAGLMAELTSDVFNPAGGCVVNGRSENCGLAMAMVNFGTGNRTNIFAVGANTGVEIGNAVKGSASPEALFSANGNDLEGFTPGDSSDTTQVGDITSQQDPNGNYTAAMKVGFARFTALPTGGVPTFNTASGMRSGGPQKPTPLDRARQLLGEQDCGNFIAELMSVAASLSTSSTTPSFQPILGPGGYPDPSYTQYYGVDQYSRAVSEGRVSASGKSGRVGDVTTFGETSNHNTISWNKEFYALGRDDAARQIIHESLHLIQGLRDHNLAGAAHMLATRDKKNPGNRGSFANQDAESQYLNRQIAKHCGGT